MVDSIAPINASIFSPDWAEMGMIGAFDAWVPLTNLVIS
jgi:hypothetical protein